MRDGIQVSVRALGTVPSVTISLLISVVLIIYIAVHLGLTDYGRATSSGKPKT